MRARGTTLTALPVALRLTLALTTSLRLTVARAIAMAALRLRYSLAVTLALGLSLAAAAVATLTLALALTLALTIAARFTTRFAGLTRGTWLARCSVATGGSLARLLAATTARTTTTRIAATARRVAPIRNRLRRDARVRLETFQHGARQFALDQAFDVAQQAVLIHANQRNRLALRTRAARTADTVHIVFRHVRQVEVDHVRQLVDVDAACGDVGGDQHAQRVGFELRKRARAGGLALVAVNRQRRDAVARELLGQAAGTVLGAREDQHLVPVVVAHKLGEQFALALAVHRIDALLDRLSRGVAACDFDQRRLVEQTVSQLADVVRERCGEQQVLALRRQDVEDLADVVDEAHVEHAIGFVQHQQFDVRQIDGALAHVVQQAARRGHDDIDTALERVDLRVDANAAEHHHRLQRQVFAVGAHTLFHLRGEFTRGGQHQRAHGEAHAVGRLHLVRLRGREAMQQRQRETGGLAGAGLCTGEQVTTLENSGDGLALNRGRFGVAEFGHGAYQLV